VREQRAAVIKFKTEAEESSNPDQSMIDKLTKEAGELLVKVQELNLAKAQALQKGAPRERTSNGGIGLNIERTLTEQRKLNQERKKLTDELANTEKAFKVFHDIITFSQDKFGLKCLARGTCKRTVSSDPNRVLLENELEAKKMEIASLIVKFLEESKRYLPESQNYIIRALVQANTGELPPAMDTDTERSKAALAVLDRPCYVFYPTTGPFKTPPLGTTDELRDKTLSMFREVAEKYRAIFVPGAEKNRAAAETDI